jgi:hypothetical protein
LTVTWNVFELELPEASVALQRTVVVWTRKREPEAGVQTTFGAESTLSAAVAT